MLNLSLMAKGFVKCAYLPAESSMSGLSSLSEAKLHLKNRFNITEETLSLKYDGRIGILKIPVVIANEMDWKFFQKAIPKPILQVEIINPESFYQYKNEPGVQSKSTNKFQGYIHQETSTTSTVIQSETYFEEKGESGSEHTVFLESENEYQIGLSHWSKFEFEEAKSHFQNAEKAGHAPSALKLYLFTKWELSSTPTPPLIQAKLLRKTQQSESIFTNNFNSPKAKEDDIFNYGMLKILENPNEPTTALKILLSAPTKGCFTNFAIGWIYVTHVRYNNRIEYGSATGYLEACAKAMFWPSYYYLGTCCLTMTVRIPEGCEWMIKAANFGSRKAKLWLAARYVNNLSTSEQFQWAKILLDELIAANYQLSETMAVLEEWKIKNQEIK